MSVAEFCRKLPKIELHTHLLGSMRPATCGEFTTRRGVKLPMDAITLFQHINSKPKPDPRYDHTRIPIPAPDSDKSPGPAYSLLDVARWLAPCMVDAGDFARVVYEALQDAARASNVRYCEMFFEPTLYFEYGVTYRTIVDGLVAGLRDAQRDFGVVGRMIAGINHAQPQSNAIELLDFMLAERRDEVIGIGLEDYELAGPPEKFVDAYRMAKKAGLHRTAHASEHDPAARNVLTCLDLLDCERIDHGYFVLEDDAAVARCRDQGVYFTCISTTSRRAWRPWRRASIKAMDAAGLRLCLGADDPGMFPTTLTNEYLIAANEIGFSQAKLKQICLNAIEASWLDESDKQRYRRDFTTEIAALERDLATAN